MPVTTAGLTAVYRGNALFDAHRDDPGFGYQFLVDEAREAGEPMAEALALRSGRLGSRLRRRTVRATVVICSCHSWHSGCEGPEHSARQAVHRPSAELQTGPCSE